MTGSANEIGQNNNISSPDGAQRALDFLSRVWNNQNITIHRTLYRNNTSWLNYAGMAGNNIIDRYRWEGGCIVQHVRFLSLRSLCRSILTLISVGQG